MVLFRVVMLGDGAVGKSAITIQLVQKKFVTDYDPTIENSYRKQMTVKDGKEELNCMLDILDTAGQEEYSVMRQQYISRGQGFVLVFSLVSETSFETVKKFRKEVLRVKRLDSPPERIPMILIGNKCDLENRKVTKEQAKERAAKWGIPYFETSAKTGDNITPSFDCIVKSMFDRERGIEKDKKKSFFKKCTIS